MDSQDLLEYTAKRYLLFGIRGYYPQGGMADLIGAYPTRELAEEATYRHKDNHRNMRFDEYDITDILTEVSTGDCW